MLELELLEEDELEPQPPPLPPPLTALLATPALPLGFEELPADGG